jgi:hypothetical protein
MLRRTFVFAFGLHNIDALFFMLWSDWYRFHKKHITRHYAELGFLHLMGSAGHIVHYGGFGP